MKIDWFDSEKYFLTDESVKRQITDSISENLTDSDLESSVNMKSALKSWSGSYVWNVQGGELQMSKSVVNLLLMAIKCFISGFWGTIETWKFPI